ncbi:S-formylglutathione hydrolase FrmB [Streptomyces sp. 1114.5]|uniref:alpha/beta hydrolase n=1 Tax=unclassified Streptomyces TaxID=2593676 RepID=UPI000BC7AED9|nr:MULTISPECIES: alpha/beta hydrolase-fold protein [unclassified Streptomyces]RKT17685.1 S-formylglutathione hydrolase FrmB [Streptomyces sp. 1114.5]SOB83889.1 S-formylglutathione hydrolase FrmB [Streptomyces sp. 1331.2]
MTTLTLASRWNPIDWPLTEGLIPHVVYVVGWGALLALAVGRDRRWWRFRLPAALFTAAALSLLLDVVVDGWWHPFPEGTPEYVTWWIAVALLGLCLAGYRMRRPGWKRRGLVLGLSALVVLMASSEVNIGFGQFPSGRVMLAPWLTKTDGLVMDKAAQTVATPPGKVLEDVWQPPAGLPEKGTVSVVPIPGARSGFKARDAYVYLPPAYQANPRPLLPVVVMITGQPGIPGDWVLSAQINEALDAYAAEHGGLAPIVVMPDQLGSTWANTLCLDSKIAKTQTYLAVDVPNWIHQNLQTATGRNTWAIGGASMGGTCALQLGVNAPDVYGTVLDMSGQLEPTLGSREQTVKAAFGGDGKKFDAVDPLHVMARRKFPDTNVALLVGETDEEFRPQMEKVNQAVQAAGMKSKFELMPGGHGWVVFRPGIAQQIPWLAQQTGLTR